MHYSNTRQTGGKRRSDFGSDLVANANYCQHDRKSSRHENTGGSRPTGKKFSAAALLDQPCAYHSREGKPTNHTTAECYSLKEMKGGGVDPDQERNTNPGFGHDVGAFHTFTGVDNRRERKVLACAIAVNAVAIDIPRWLNWSDQTITWSRKDHAPRIEYPGRVVLIAKPKVADYWLAKTLMDGGISITILYYDTFR
jgi:hypothetical protein